MRYPASETAEKHERILGEAARLFRERGYSGVSVSEIMQATGLTHGPFYSHFASKDALFAEALTHLSERGQCELERAAATPDAMRAYLAAYLSAQHRDHPGHGCLMPAVGSEVGRAGERQAGARSAYTRHVKRMLAWLGQAYPWPAMDTARRDAHRMLASMIGAVILARAVDDAQLSDDILRDVREQFLT